MSKLNPCPFCGGQAIMKIQKHIPNGYDYTPTCQDPSCAGRLTKKWVNEADAIEAPYRYCPNCGMEMERGDR